MSDNITWENILKLFVAMLASVGGAGVIILLLSNWLGRIWAERVLNKHKAELDKEIEEVKKRHTTEIESYKSELEKARNDYHRFSNKKFEIIEETWSAMISINGELKIYNPNEGGYIKSLQENINILNKYLTIIKKNSLFFNDEIKELLLKYVSICSEVVTVANEKIKNVHNTQEELNNILPEIFKKSLEKEEVLDKIRIKFQKELGEQLG